MPALDYNADTEFNDALRRYGIIPEKESTSTSSRSPSPVLPASPTLSSLGLDELDDLSLNLDDTLSREELERLREVRLKEQKAAEGNRRFGRVYPIGKRDYTREVTEASEEELEGEPEGSGVGVVCVLYKDYIPECKLLLPLLTTLASQYPSTKFVSIISDHCIENYPDKNCPTMLVYRKGKMMGQIVGIGAMGGDKMTLRDVERILFAFRGIDFHLKVGYSSGGSQFSSKASSDLFNPLGKNAGETKKEEESDGDDSDDDDQAFVGGGKRSGIRQTRRKAEDSSDGEFDL